MTSSGEACHIILPLCSLASLMVAVVDGFIDGVAVGGFQLITLLSFLL